MEIALINNAVFVGSLMVGLVYDYFLSRFLIAPAQQINRNRSEKFNLIRHLPLIAINIIMLCALSSISIVLFQQYFTMARVSLLIFIPQFLLLMIFDDIEFYCWHRLLHHNHFMMKQIHAVHHRARIPYPIEFIYAHPIEWLGGTLGIVFAFILIVHFYGSASVYVLWSYTGYRVLREMSSHSNFTVYFTNKIPFLPICGSKHHAAHHIQLHGNYASTFTYLDRIFSTQLTE